MTVHVESLPLTHFIQPSLLEEFYNSQEEVKQKLNAEDASSLNIEKKSYINNEAEFRFAFNEDAMAVEKLREAISKFAADAVTLKEILEKKLEESS
jgi:transaldolase